STCCRVIPVSHSISSYYLPLLQPCCIAAWAPTMLLLTSSSVFAILPPAHFLNGL
uniref:Uncharacterized protein n=1 Tax=Aegilops tauschii subsp. strangulata TaxID=200361 RepID=A0A453QBL0_AEGTS